MWPCPRHVDVAMYPEVTMPPSRCGHATKQLRACLLQKWPSAYADIAVPCGDVAMPSWICGPTFMQMWPCLPKGLGMPPCRYGHASTELVHASL